MSGARNRRPIVRTGDEIDDYRLVGMKPLFSVRDAEVDRAKDPRLPGVTRSAIVLTASKHDGAQVAAASCQVNKALISCLQHRDEIYLSRTMCAGLGISILRDGELLVAIGAVTTVPLGVKGAETLRAIPDCWDRPIVGARLELTVETHTVGDYIVSIVHGRRNGIPGFDECASICRADACPEVAARTSAMLLDSDWIIAPLSIAPFKRWWSF
jgi:hypothetical protein